MTPPFRLQFKSDGNEMEYVETLKADMQQKQSQELCTATPSAAHKLNSTLSLTEIQLKKMIDKQWVIDIS
jgi:hypothetical protein